MEKLDDDAIREGLERLDGWSLDDDGRIGKTYRFDDFAAALAFTNRVGEAAEAQNHHPDITLGWGYADVRVSTHSAGGITPKDFRLAAACEEAGGA